MDNFCKSDNVMSLMPTCGDANRTAVNEDVLVVAFDCVDVL